MAVMNEHPGIKVEIVVADTLLPEYEDDQEQHVPNVITKYIEAQTDREFAVRAEFDTSLIPLPPNNCFVVSVDLDEKRGVVSICTRSIRTDRPTLEELDITCLLSHVGTTCFKQKFYFKDLTISKFCATHTLV